MRRMALALTTAVLLPAALAVAPAQAAPAAGRVGVARVQTPRGVVAPRGFFNTLCHQVPVLC